MKIRRLRKIKNLSTGVIVEDRNGLLWNISQQAYDTMKYIGMPRLDPNIETSLCNQLHGRNFADLSKTERYELLYSLIQEVTQTSVQDILPSVDSVPI